MSTSSETHTFSWGRGLLYAGAAFFLFIIFAMVLLVPGVTDSEQARKLGQSLGRMAFWVAALALVYSYGKQTQKSWLVWLGGMGISLFFLFVLGVKIWVEPHSPPRPLTKEDKQALVSVEEGNKKFFKHPHLGFTLENPGEQCQMLSHEDVKAMSAYTFQKEMDVHTYGFACANTGELVLIFISGATVTQNYLKQFITGFAEEGSHITKQEIIWNDLQREAIIWAQKPPIELRVRGIAANLGPQKQPYLITIVAGSTDPQTSQRLVDSLRLP